MVYQPRPGGRGTPHLPRSAHGGLPNDPSTVLQAVLDSFQAHHGEALPELDSHTRRTIREHVPKVFNWEQRHAIEHDPVSITELQRAVDRRELCPALTDYSQKRTNASPCPSRAAWKSACGT